MKTIYLLFFVLIGVAGQAQNTQLDIKSVNIYSYPLHPLDKSLKTYSANILEIGWIMNRIDKDSLYRSGLVIPGYQRVKVDGDIQIEVIMNPFTVTARDLRDKPITNEKDGVQSVVHQYWYDIRYSFPAKIRLLARGKVITEQDLPGTFSAEYHASNNRSEAEIQREYSNDIYFLNGLLSEKLKERKAQIRNWLFSNYGCGFTFASVGIGTIKDKKGVYPEVTKAYSLMIDAFTSMYKKKDYLDEGFKSKMNEVIEIYEQLLTEHNPDKKARVNNKVAGLAHYNIALAYYMLREFDKAEERILLVKHEYGNPARNLKNSIDNYRRRLAANGLIDGVAPTEIVVPTESTPSESTPAEEKTETGYRDYIVFASGDTVYTRFLMPPQDVMQYGDSVWLQNQVIVVENGEAIEVDARNISSYSYNGIIRETFSRVVDTSTLPFKIEYTMCKRTLTGPISLYQCHRVEPSFRDKSVMVVVTHRYYKKEDKFQVAAYGNFNKGVAKLVSDYPELSLRVKNGEFKKNDLEKVVQQYNEWAKEKK